MNRWLSVLLIFGLIGTLFTACSGNGSQDASSASAASASAESVASNGKGTESVLNSYSHHTAKGYSTVTVYKDLFYGDRRDRSDEGDGCTTGQTDSFGHGYYRHRSGQNFDLYLPDYYTEDASVLLILHGGSWCQPADKDSEEVAGFSAKAAAKGFVVVNMDYMLQADMTANASVTLYEDATFDTMLRDVDTCVTYLKSFLPTIGITPKKIAISGGSAGGYLATAYAYDAACPSQLGLGLKHDIPIGFVVDVVGPTDLSSEEWMTLSGSAAATAMGYDRLFAALIADKDTTVSLPQRVKKYSALSMINANTPPTILMYDQAPEESDLFLKYLGVPSDGLVPVFTYDHMLTALKAAGVPCEGKLMPNALHGSVDEAWLLSMALDYCKYLS